MSRINREVIIQGKKLLPDALFDHLEAAAREIGAADGTCE